MQGTGDLTHDTVGHDATSMKWSSHTLLYGIAGANPTFSYIMGNIELKFLLPTSSSCLLSHQPFFIRFISLGLLTGAETPSNLDEDDSSDLTHGKYTFMHPVYEYGQA